MRLISSLPPVLLLIWVISVSTSAIASAPARERLLDCNLSDGELQGVTIYREIQPDETEKLILSQLDTNGDRHERTLGTSEWKRKKIRLYATGRAKSWLILEDGGWTFTFDAPGYSASGDADCK